jgi:hypothetical protein
LLISDLELEKILGEDQYVVKRRGEYKRALIALRAAKDEVEAMQ